MTTIRPLRRDGRRGLLAKGLDAAFPPACPGCGTEGELLCARCGRALAVRRELPPGLRIGLPGELPHPLRQLEWAAPFTGVVRNALHALKYGGETRLAEPIGRAMAARWRSAGRGAELVVPVPVHAARERERGYDQALLLAVVVGRELGLPVARALVRERATRAQFALGRAARAGNVAGAFGLRPLAGARLDGRLVLLVDDVVTTGATLASCAVVLRAGGAAGVAALTAARER